MHTDMERHSHVADRIRHSMAWQASWRSLGWAERNRAERNRMRDHGSAPACPIECVSLSRHAGPCLPPPSAPLSMFSRFGFTEATRPAASADPIESEPPDHFLRPPAASASPAAERTHSGGRLASAGVPSRRVPSRRSPRPGPVGLRVESNDWRRLRRRVHARPSWRLKGSRTDESAGRSLRRANPSLDASQPHCTTTPGQTACARMDSYPVPVSACARPSLSLLLPSTRA